MIRLRNLSLFPLILTLATPALAAEALDSGRVGNGGFAYVCRAKSGKITFARLLDLWEAEGVPTWNKNDAIDTQIEAALGRLGSYSVNSRRLIRGNLNALKDSVVYSDRPLTSTEDAFPAYRPARGCGYEQVARYEPVLAETGQQGLRIHTEIFHSAHFSNSDRAALFFHEAVYLTDRLRNEATNSQRSRMIVAHLFSDSKIPNAVRLVTAALLGTEAKPVHASKNVFIAVADPLRIAYEVRFEEVDGISNGNVRSMTAEQKQSQYRCTVLGGPEEPSTGWVNLAELIRVTPNQFPREEGGIAIAGEAFAFEFDPENEATAPDASIPLMTTLEPKCEKKDFRGKISTVTYRDALLSFPNSLGLEIQADGATAVHDSVYRIVNFREAATRGAVFINAVRKAP
jgi:hypothetical protein